MKRSKFTMRFFVVWLVLCLGLVGFTLTGGEAQQESPIANLPAKLVSPGVRLIKSDENSVILELSTPGYELEKAAIDGVTHHLLSVPDYGLLAEKGAPQLPMKAVMVGVPVESTVTMRILEADDLLLPNQYDIRPAPRPIVDWELPELRGGGASLAPRYLGQEFVKDEKVYLADAFYPAELASVTDVGFIRQQRVARLELHPFQYNSMSRQVRMVRRLVVELTFTYPEGKAPSSLVDIQEAGGFEEILRSSLLNYESARWWRGKVPQAALTSFQPPPQPGYRVVVEQDGIYEMTYDDLDTAGLPVSGPDPLDPLTFQLFNKGDEVAIYVKGEGDGNFGEDDYIIFYGEALDTRYTRANVYWLTYGQTYDVSRMDKKDGTPSETPSVPGYFEATVLLEENPRYWSNMPGGDDQDRWVWTYVYGKDPVPGSWTTPEGSLSLPNMVSGTYSATLRAQLHGNTADDSVDLDHHVKLYVNDNFVGHAWWDGKTSYPFVAEFPSAHLTGTNTIKVECPGDTGRTGYDVVWIDWLEVDYRRTYTTTTGSDYLRFFGSDQVGTWDYHVSGFATDDFDDSKVFDITDPANVSRVVSATVETSSSYTLKFKDTVTDTREYWALTTAERLSPVSIELDTPSNLQLTTNGADYIIITHSDFYTDVLALDNRRATQGPRTMVVDVQDVYDEFSYGVFDPRAIRDFLAYSFSSWVEPPPSYVLLVGDGHYDFKDNKSSGMGNYIPPYMAAEVDDTIGEAPADNRYVCLSGGDDIWPDMHIGRLPANSSAEAQVMVNKILSYEQNPPSGDWNSKVLFVAEDQPDGAGNFWDLSDDIANNYLPSAYTADKVYYDSHPGDPILYHPDPPRPQPPYYSGVDDVRAAAVAAMNEGCLLVNYVGHGAVTFWAEENLFGINDISSLTNGLRLPMMLPMTCQEGYFASPYPTAPSLGESLVRADGKGAIASWSATGWGMALGHHYLDKGFFTAVFSDTISEIGTATYLGKLNLYDSTDGYRDLMDTYVLFGDPFMKLNLPACDAADYDNDGRITVGDVMQVAAHWDTEWGDANFDRKYDLDDDGDVDIVDVMWVAGRWEEVC